MRVLVAGSTGFIGERLVHALLEQDDDVRCLVRETGRGEALAARGCEVVEADLTRPDQLHGACEDIEIAYYLVHMMGDTPDFARSELDAARAFASACTRAGVKRVIYLGGLGDRPDSEHLRSRHVTAEVLRSEGPPLTYFRAGIVVGAESASFKLLRDVVERLPVLLEPEWLRNRTQPIGIDDLIAYLIQAPALPESKGIEVQVGGPDVLSYSELLDEMALALGIEPRPTVRARLSPEGMGAGAGAVTLGNRDLAASLTESLSVETIVTDPSGAALFDVHPKPLALALSKAVDEQDGVVRPSYS